MTLSPLSPTPDNDITRYFVKLGYKVSWDFSRRTDDQWYEINDDQGEVAQIDMTCTLAGLREDMTCWREGREATSADNGRIALPDTARSKRLLKRVVEIES